MPPSWARSVRLVDANEDRIAGLIAHCRDLEAVSVFYSSIKDDAVELLARCPRLHSVSLTGCKRVTGSGLLAVAKACPLRHLDVSGCRQVTDASMVPLAGYTPELVSLKTSGNKGITTTTVVAFAAACPKVSHWRLSGCTDVHDEALSEIAERCPQLDSISVAGCSVTDSGLIQLANGCPRLRYLKCSAGWAYPELDVTDRGLRQVAALCPYLETIKAAAVFGGITAEGMAALSAAFPRLRAEAGAEPHHRGRGGDEAARDR